MRLALSKKGLGPAIENEVWHYAFIAPSAKAMGEITIEDKGWRKRITPKAGVHVKAGMGRKMVNPCSMCEDAELTCVTDYCGQCRSRPVVRRARRMSYLGMGCSQLTDVSPRTKITDCPPVCGERLP